MVFLQKIDLGETYIKRTRFIKSQHLDTLKAAEAGTLER
jgi:hypothetical protein